MAQDIIMPKIFIKVPVPDCNMYEYTVRHTIWHEMELHVLYWEVKPDGSKVFIGSGYTGKTKNVVLEEWFTTHKL